MRPKTEEVLEGLKAHAFGEQHALRSNVLAVKLDLPKKIVSNALNWLVVDGKHPRVRRARQAGSWFKYWWVEEQRAGDLITKPLERTR